MDGKLEGATLSEHICYLGLGSSLGDRTQHLQDAIDRLNREPDRLRIRAVSGLYESPHMGLHPEDELRYPPHMNCVVEVATKFTPQELLERVREVEDLGGRLRVERWGPRTIDIDILLYDNLALNSEALTLPHPEIADRAFVLLPLLDIAPNIALPDGSSVQASVHSGAIQAQQIDRLAWGRE